MHKLASERIGALFGGARDAVLIAASLSRPTVDAIVAALPGEVDGIAAVLVETEDAGILVTERGRVRFTHPLLASAVYGSVSDTARRALHLRLAEVVTTQRSVHATSQKASPSLMSRPRARLRMLLSRPSCEVHSTRQRSCSPPRAVSRRLRVTMR
jgi:hypothetical protein